jgi:hypothetical protein
MGNAGITRELLRYARIQNGDDQRYAVTWPDHPPATPGQPLRAESRAGLSSAERD